MRLQAESLCLQRNRPTASERVEHRGRPAVEALGDLGVRLAQEPLVAGVLPHDELFQKVEQALSLERLFLLGRESIRVRGRIVDELREQHSTTRRKRPTRPPQVQRGGVPVPD